MKYYRYIDPFSALIAANSREEADLIYKEEVLLDEGADSEEDNAFEPAKELTEQEAAARCEKVGLDMSAAAKPAILLIDAELI